MADKHTLARPYAQAAFDIARESDALEAWSEALAAAGAVLADRRVTRFLANPALTDEQRLGFLTGLIGSAAGKGSVLAGGNSQGSNFVRLLLEYGRVSVLPEIAEHFEALKARVENTLDVTVTSAAPLSAAHRQKITIALKQRLGREVNLQMEINENLIGGAVIRAGDVVIDGSLRSRLESLSNALTA